MKPSVNSPYKFNIIVTEKQISYSIQPNDSNHSNTTGNGFSRGVAAGVAALVLVTPSVVSSSNALMSSQASSSQATYSINQVDLDDYSYETPYRDIVTTTAKTLIKTQKIKAPNSSEYDIWS
jgi:hypothetical protein